MIKAKHNKLYHWFFVAYTRFLLKKHFRDVQFIGNVIPSNNSHLLIGNHFSWWDGFIAFWINHKFLKKQFNVMMLEEQLKQRPFLQRIGAYSINPGKKTIIHSIRHTIDLLKESGNMVCLYPQGAIKSMHNHELTFGEGIQRVISSSGRFTLLMYVCLIDYGSSPKPLMNIYFKQVESFSSVKLSELYQNFYNECVNKQNMITW